MNCDDARDIVLDSLAGPVPDEQSRLMETHIASCDACRRFDEIQRALDARLTGAMPLVNLSSDFRRSLRQKIESREASIWPESLPDIAHLTGCASAIALLLLVLPQYSRTVLLTGLGFTAVTYFLRAVLR